MPPRDQIGDGIAVARRGRLHSRTGSRARAPGAAPHRRQRHAAGAVDQSERRDDAGADNRDGAQPARTDATRREMSWSRPSRAAATASPRRARSDGGDGAGGAKSQLSFSRTLQALPWMVVRTPESIPEISSALRDMMWLGKPSRRPGRARSLGCLRRAARQPPAHGDAARPRPGRTSAAAPRPA